MNLKIDQFKQDQKTRNLNTQLDLEYIYIYISKNPNNSIFYKIKHKFNIGPFWPLIHVIPKLWTKTLVTNPVFEFHRFLLTYTKSNYGKTKCLRTTTTT